MSAGKGYEKHVVRISLLSSILNCNLTEAIVLGHYYTPKQLILESIRKWPINGGRRL